MPTCPVCGQQFTANTPHHTYCGRSCKDKALYRIRNGLPVANAPPHKCEVCGEMFAPTMPWQKYCSPSCQTKAKNRRTRGHPIPDAEYYAKFPPHAQCPVCGQTFERWRNDMSQCQGCVKRASTRKYRKQPIADAKHYDSRAIYYVYGWVDTDERSDTGVFYIGKGKGDRANRNSRNKSPLAEAIRAVAEMKGTFSIVYFAENLPEKEAYDKEAQLIAQYRPVGNEQHNPDYNVGRA